MAASTDRLRKIKTLDELVGYLRDEMGWPIETDDEDPFEDIAFEYTPEELGIDDKPAAKIESIKRLRPLTANQPWGIFFVEFEPKKLPVTALRRILKEVVTTKRASASKAERVTWDMEDLMFISAIGGDGSDRAMNFAHFSQGDEGRLPSLKVVAWDSDDTPLHMEDVSEKLTEKLAWPDNEEDTDTWREAWSSAFTLHHGQVIKDSKKLAVLLADLARDIRSRILDVLVVEDGEGPLTDLMTTFQEALIHDLDEDDFADMYAQTIAYGLLSARIIDPDRTPGGPSLSLPLTSPFLRELMEELFEVGSAGTDSGGAGIDFDEIGVGEIIDLLDNTDMEAVVRDFGDQNPLEDPVIHFYERFLAEYDADTRMQRGVFYTPRPVVSFIVRSVDQILRTNFGLLDGLADTTTWGEMVARSEGIALPEGIAPSAPFVQILDPATGTGTFLVEVVDVVHSTLTEKWASSGHNSADIVDMWNRYVAHDLLPRLFGYELLMAPYAIAHLKIAMKLLETGYQFESKERARIYLTNSLEPSVDVTSRFDFAVQAVAHEALAVNEVKSKQVYTVVLGNPPYANYSANLGIDARRLVDGYRSFAGEPIRERNQLQFERNLQDDFVKFIAVGEHDILRADVGVLGYITNANVLAAPTLRGVRERLITAFDDLFELHLHGGLNESIQGDENVFSGITQSVAIHIYVRHDKTAQGRVHYAELKGSRSHKFAALAHDTVHHERFASISPDAEVCGFVPQDEASGLAQTRIDKVFSQFGAGVKTNQDATAIAFDIASLRSQIKTLDPDLPGEGQQEPIQSILYRPFDRRFVYYDARVVRSRSLPTMSHMVNGENIALIASSSWTRPDRFSVGVSDRLIEMKTGTHDRGSTLFPLYRYEAILDGETQRVVNLSPEFIADWHAATGVQIAEAAPAEGRETVTARRVFDWLYGITHAPMYRQNLRASLARGFPIMLYPVSHAVFEDVSSIGAELIETHLLNERLLDISSVQPIGMLSEAQVERITWEGDTVWINSDATKGFSGVPEYAWNTYIGGYRPCEKWLKDRKASGGKNPRPAKRLSNTEIDEYRYLVAAVKLTAKLQSQLESVLGVHGGWPLAFKGASVSPAADNG